MMLKVVKLSDREGRFDIIRRGEKTARVVPLVDGGQIIRVEASTIMLTGEVVAAPAGMIEIALVAKAEKKEAAPSLEKLDFSSWENLLVEPTSPYWVCVVFEEAGVRNEFESKEKMVEFVSQNFGVDVKTLTTYWFSSGAKVIILGGLDESIDCL